MSVSWVNTCNTALAMLGKDPIISLTEGTAASTICNQLLSGVVDATLRAHAWGCARYRATLAQVSSYTPPSDYAYAYQLPTNPYCLRVLWMGDKSDRYDWRIEGRYLVTSEAEAIILYIKRITDPTEMDSLLLDAIAARLASDMALALTGSRAMREDLFGMYKDKLSEAQLVDNRENVTETTAYENTWEGARR